MYEDLLNTVQTYYSYAEVVQKHSTFEHALADYYRKFLLFGTRVVDVFGRGKLSELFAHFPPLSSKPLTLCN
jgi:hypothetical protein